MNEKNSHSKYMHKAIEMARLSLDRGGGPFGAIIVKNGQIISKGHNCVTLHNDPTAHAEVVTIRKACKKLKTFDLSGCEIYTSCEPCPMCLAAIYWARLEKIYYGCTKNDAQDIGFDDSFIYEQFNLMPKDRSITTEQLLQENALEIFHSWENKEDKTEY